VTGVSNFEDLGCGDKTYVGKKVVTLPDDTKPYIVSNWGTVSQIIISRG
jgi:hypothetical protein